MNEDVWNTKTTLTLKSCVTVCIAHAYTADRLVFLYALFFLIMFPINVYFLSINSYLFINKTNIHLKHKIKKEKNIFQVRKRNNKDIETSRIMLVVGAVCVRVWLCSERTRQCTAHRLYFIIHKEMFPSNECLFSIRVELNYKKGNENQRK